MSRNPAQLWTPYEVKRLEVLRGERRQGWDYIETQFPGRSREALQTKWHALQNWSGGGHKQTGELDFKDTRVRQANIARARDARLNEPPPSSITAALCGDPPAGRSALDRRSQHQPRPITLAKGVAL